jgi:hypothetical protein
MLCRRAQDKSCHPLPPRHYLLSLHGNIEGSPDKWHTSGREDHSGMLKELTAALRIKLKTNGWSLHIAKAHLSHSLQRLVLAVPFL